MPELSADLLEPYLSRLFDAPVRVTGFSRLGGGGRGSDLKEYGYGVPVLVEYEARGEKRRAVLETTSPGPYGHETRADRAAMLLWDHEAYNRLPRHARSLDVGAFREKAAPLSLGDAGEFFLLVEYLPGEEYIGDLARLQGGGPLRDLDIARSRALCDYLVGIHAERGPDPGLYARRIRELLGHGECIFGIVDGYPARHGFITPEILEEIEHACVRWRWRLRGRADRLRRVHGDFHPYNILFRDGTDFSVIDRSRGEWGEPADDVTSLTGNYLFSSLQAHGRLAGAFETLFRGFWDRYLEGSGDPGVLTAAPPFYAFRCLVMASPAWYPRLDEDVRRRLFAFLRSVLAEDAFDPARTNAYCGL